jgi:acylphosphatase
MDSLGKIYLEVFSMKVRVRVYISGMVQGVFFRHETKKRALRHGISGWVRNLENGCVEALFEGETEAIEKMLNFCRKGPPGADVQNLEVNTETWKGEFQDFTVKY